MKKTDLIRNILMMALCILFLVCIYTGYPASWFFHGSLHHVSIITVSYIVNCLIILILTLGLGFIFHVFKDSKKVFSKYAFLCIALTVLSLFGQFIGRFKHENYGPNFLMVLCDGILQPCLRDGTILMVLMVLIGYPLSTFNYPKKNLWNSVILTIVSLIFALVFHLRSTGMEIYFYLSIAFGMGLLSSYMLYEEGSIYDAAIFFAVAGLSYLPEAFYPLSVIPNLTIFIISILYLITGSISLGMILNKETTHNS